MLAYQIGLMRGRQRALIYKSLVFKLNNAFSIYQASLLKFTSNQHPSDNDAKQLINGFNSSAIITQISQANEQTFNLNASILNPKYEDEKFRALPKSPTALCADTLSSGTKKSLLVTLHSNFLICPDNQDVLFFNSPRVVGMTLAFLNLMVLRSEANYKSNFQDDSTFEKYQDAVLPKGKTLLDLANGGSMNQITNSDFVISSILSGYDDSYTLLLNERSFVDSIAGVKADQAAALQIFKNAMNNQIPGLDNAADINQAVMIISSFVSQQRTEIDSLRNMVNQLNTILNNVNQLVVNANGLISSLTTTSNDVQATLGKINNLADEGTLFFKVGTVGIATLIAGPIGGATMGSYIFDPNYLAFASKGLKSIGQPIHVLFR